MHFLLLAALLLHIPAHSNTQARLAAERLREESVQSAALGRPMKYRVLLPSDYGSSQRRYPVLYLLHGLGGDYKDWTTRTNVAEYSRTLPLIIVMPDGEKWWPHFIRAASPTSTTRSRAHTPGNTGIGGFESFFRFS